jgi:exopolysaccharide production protein ExoZ
LVLLFVQRKYFHFPISQVAESFLFLPITAHSANFPGLPIDFVGWTLHVEMLFYMVLACALCLPRAWVYFTVAAFLSAVVIVGRLFESTYPGLVYSLANPLMFEFIFGIGLGLIYVRKHRIPAWLAPVAFALLFSLVIWILPRDVLPSFFPRAFVWGIPCAGIVAAAALGPQPRPSSLLAKGLVIAGNCSYALYVGFPVVAAVMARWAAPPSRVLFISIAGSILVYFLIERPITVALRSAVRRKQIGFVLIPPLSAPLQSQPRDA